MVWGRSTGAYSEHGHHCGQPGNRLELTRAEITLEPARADWRGSRRYCAARGESLEAMADNLGADWLQLWGANAHLSSPRRLAAQQPINLGALYTACFGDTLGALALRFGTSLPTALVSLIPFTASIFLPLTLPIPSQATSTSVCLSLVVFCFVRLHVSMPPFPSPHPFQCRTGEWGRTTPPQ